MSELVAPSYSPSTDWKPSWSKQKSQFYVAVHTSSSSSYTTDSHAAISIGLRILHENVFQIHKTHANCISITKYKLLLLSSQNTKYTKRTGILNNK